MTSDTGFLKSLNALKAAASLAERTDLCHLLEESYALMKRWNCAQLRLWVIRDKVFEPIQLAVESNDSRLCTPAVNCLQTFLHDDRFKSCTEFTSDPRWIPIQVLHTLAACSSFSEEVQIEVLKILLDIALTSQWSLNANLLIKLVESCLRMADNFPSPCEGTLPRMVSSTLNQILESVVTNYQRWEPETFDSIVRNETYACCSPLPDLVLCPEKERTVTSDTTEPEPTVRVEQDNADTLRHDLLTVLAHLVDCICSLAPVDLQTSSIVLSKSGRIRTLLSAVQTVLLHLPTGIVRFRLFTDLIWKSLCPSLIALMHANLADGSPNKKLTGTVTSPEFGRGSGVNNANCLLSPEIYHIVYKITLRLAQLLGPLIEMRPVLESLFHSVLLYPPPRQRATALQVMQPLLSSELELIRITLPCWHIVALTDESQQPTYELVPVSDWAAVNSSTGTIPAPFRLIRILLDSLTECSCSGVGGLAQSSMNGMTALFSTLERLSTGSQLESWLTAYLVPQLTQLTKESVANQDNCTFASTHSEHKSECPNSHNNKYASLAVEFLNALQHILPNWFQCGSLDELDRSMLGFSSQFCTTICGRSEWNQDVVLDCTNPETTILNADAIYLVSYATLALNWRLWLYGYYTNKGAWKLTDEDQQQFVDSILNRNLLVYLPVAFLTEIYRLVTNENYLLRAGLDADTIRFGHVTTLPTAVCTNPFVEPGDIPGSVLCTTLNAYNGIRGDLQVRSDYRLFLFDQPPALVGAKLVQYFLQAVWDPALWSIAGVFCTPELFGPRIHLRIVQLDRSAQLELHTPSTWTRFLPVSNGTENRLAMGRATLDAVNLIRTGVRLAAKLDQHAKVAQLIELIVHVVWTSLGSIGDVWDSSGIIPVDNSSSVGSVQTSKGVGLHAVHILLLDTIFRCVTDGGIRDEQSWWMVFRACRLVTGLEHRLFATTSSGIPSRQPDRSASGNDNIQNASQFLLRLLGSSGTLNFDPSTPDSSVTLTGTADHHLLVGSPGLLNASTTEHLLTLLHQVIDHLFQQSVVDRFTLPELIAFSKALLAGSRESTFTSTVFSISSTFNVPAMTSLDPFGINPLLDRLCQVLLDLVRSVHRPLIHLVYLWAAVANDLIKVCHLHGWFSDCAMESVPQSQVVQRVLDAMHSCILTGITNYPELPRFTTNEAWCKPLENTIKLELCDSDVQDRLITCICALVESGSDYLRSAWKPLFSALRSVRPECVRLPTHSTGSSTNTRAIFSHQFGLFQRMKRTLFQSPRPKHESTVRSEHVVDKETGAAVDFELSDTCQPTTELNARRLGTVLEICEVYLSTVNEDVFCETAVDCLLCLLHFLTVFHRSTNQSTSTDSPAICRADAFPVLSVFDAYGSCTTDSRNLYPEDVNAILFRADPNWDDSAAGTKISDSDPIPGTNANITTVFLSTLTCLIRSVYWLERLWSMPRAPTIKQARHQSRLYCALDQEDSTDANESESYNHHQHPLFVALDALDRGTGVLFAYGLIVNQLFDLIWTADRVQRSLLLDTALRLISGASLGFPSSPGSPHKQYHDYLTIQLTNHLLLPKIRRWIVNYTHSYPSFKQDRLHMSANKTSETEYSNGSSEYTLTTSSPQPVLNGVEQSITSVSQSAPSTRSIEPIRCSFCAAQYHDLRFLRGTLGQATELVINYAGSNHSTESADISASFEQLLTLLRLATTFPNDSLCYLGPTCIRHILTTHGHSLPEHYWTTLVETLIELLVSTRGSLDVLFSNDDDKTVNGTEREHRCIMRSNDVHRLRLITLQLCSGSTGIDPVHMCPIGDWIIVDETARNESSTATINSSSIELLTEPICLVIRSLLSHELLIQTVIDLFIWRAPSEQMLLRREDEFSETELLSGSDGVCPLFGIFDKRPTEDKATEYLTKLTAPQCLKLIQCLEQRYQFCLTVHRNADAQRRLFTFLGTEIQLDLMGHAVKTVVIALRILAYLILKHRVTMNLVQPTSPVVSTSSDSQTRITFPEFLTHRKSQWHSASASSSCQSDKLDWSVLPGLFAHWFDRMILGSAIIQSQSESEHSKTCSNSDLPRDSCKEIKDLPLTDSPNEVANGPSPIQSLKTPTNHIRSHFVQHLSGFLIWLEQLTQFFHLSTSSPSQSPTEIEPTKLDVWCISNLSPYRENLADSAIYDLVHRFESGLHHLN